MKKKTILIAEDETLIAFDLKNRLERHGYLVLLTGTAVVAVELALKMRPDIILMDIILKDEKTWIAAAGIIHDSYTVPIIFMTGNTHLCKDERLKKIPIYKILGKPPVERVLMDMIEKLLEND
jgi:DNA-binding response OmpR family regulator